MLGTFVAVILPLFLVFGLYNLLTWFNVFGLQQKAFWKRLALVSAVAHFLLATGFFVFTYFDFRASDEIAALGVSYGRFMFDRSEFWRLIAILDTLPMMVILALFTILEQLGVTRMPGILLVTMAITYVLGTVQWYYLGGAAGAMLERLWSGLKTEDEEDDWLE